MTIHGIDVSAYQSTDYSTKGIDFVFIKATEGHTYINPRMNAQTKHGRDAGLVVGFYHFLWPGNIAEQARYFVEKCASVEGDPLFVDWETTSEGTHASCAEKDAFLRELNKLRGDNHKLGLYCNRNFWLNEDTTSNAGDALWIADYVTPGKPHIKAKWMFHQYTSSPIDKNVGRFDDRADLRKWCGGSKTSDGESRPHVSLDKLVAAARHDPPKDGRPVSYDGTKIVEKALAAEGLLEHEYVDGHFGTATVAAYGAWQRRCGYHGDDADGIPGRASLEKLGHAHGFDVTA